MNLKHTINAMIGGMILSGAGILPISATGRPSIHR